MTTRATFIVLAATALAVAAASGTQAQNQPPCVFVGQSTTPGISQPTNLQISLEVDSLSVVVTWEDNADNETCYHIQRTFLEMNDLQGTADLPANATEYRTTLYDQTHSGPGTYCFGVTARNASGTSEQAWGCVDIVAPFVGPAPAPPPIPSPIASPPGPPETLPYTGPGNLPDSGGAPDSGGGLAWWPLTLAGAGVGLSLIWWRRRLRRSK